MATAYGVMGNRRTNEHKMVASGCWFLRQHQDFTEFGFLHEKSVQKRGQGRYIPGAIDAMTLAFRTFLLRTISCPVSKLVSPVAGVCT